MVAGVGTGATVLSVVSGVDNALVLSPCVSGGLAKEDSLLAMALAFAF